MNKVELYEQIPVGELPIRLLSFKNISPPFFHLHWHEHTEILFITDGFFKVRVGDNQLRLEEGDCLVINANELHESIEGSIRCSYVGMLIPPEFFENNHIIFKTLIRDEFVRGEISAIFSADNSGDSISTLEIRGHAYLLMSYLMRNFAEKTLADSVYSRYFERMNKINAAIKYIDDNFTENITTKDLSQLSHMSEGHFCYVFRDVTGKTAKEYITDLRIKKAAMLLENSDMTVTEIAYCCGFCDSNYFARIFKKYTGKTPTALRR